MHTFRVCLSSAATVKSLERLKWLLYGEDDIKRPSSERIVGALCLDFGVVEENVPQLFFSPLLIFSSLLNEIDDNISSASAGSE